MAEFLVETYASRDTANAASPLVDGVPLAADKVSEESTDVRLMRVILVPEDETCFYHFESSSAAAVRASFTRAGLHFDRITEAVSIETARNPRSRTAMEPTTAKHVT